jgi:hypothetical protein
VLYCFHSGGGTLLRPRFFSYLIYLTLSLSSVTIFSGCPANGDVKDGGGPGDYLLPPDFIGGGDGNPIPQIGGACDVTSGDGCEPGASCLSVGLGVGVCTIVDCTLEDTATSQREDSCPLEAACAKISVASDNGNIEDKNFCLPTCVPSSTANPCAATNPGLACSPVSVLLTGYTEVCVVPACKKDVDCGSGGDLNPNATCDTSIGVCFGKGVENVPVGAVCSASSECGPGQLCYQHSNAATGQKIAGYCTVLGCVHGGLWECSGQSGCYSFGATKALSLCLATGCNDKAPPDSDGCRDDPADDNYRCYQVGEKSVCWLNLTSDDS